MYPYHFTLHFAFLDLDDDAVVEALAPTETMTLYLSSTEGITTVQAVVAARSLPEALMAVIAKVNTAAPAAKAA